jgi:hypothetical protein
MRAPKKNPFIFDPKTDKVEFRMPTPVDVMARRAKKAFTGVDTQKCSRRATKKQYLGETDPAKFLHSNRTHRTASEAFRDADYATAIWKCKTDWDRTKEYLGWVLMWAGFLFLMYQSMVGFEKWIGS